MIYWSATLCLAAGFGITFWRDEHHRRELQSYLGTQQTKKARLEDALERRKQRAEFLKTREGQEWIARDKLNMALPGEKIFRLDLSDRDGTQALPEKDDSAIIVQ